MPFSVSLNPCTKARQSGENGFKSVSCSGTLNIHPNPVDSSPSVQHQNAGIDPNMYVGLHNSRFRVFFLKINTRLKKQKILDGCRQKLESPFKTFFLQSNAVPGCPQTKTTLNGHHDITAMQNLDQNPKYPQAWNGKSHWQVKTTYMNIFHSLSYMCIQGVLSAAPECVCVEGKGCGGSNPQEFSTVRFLQ